MWRPTILADNLIQRAQILSQIRGFFAARNVLEVETPILGQGGNPDPHLDNFTTRHQQQTYYLQTSPEFHMKRLLASGCGPIFQISKAFRCEESGRYHNPEFTLLEWYRPGFDHHQLMQEVDELLQHVVKTAPSDIVTYAQIFQSQLALDPHRCSEKTLINCARAHGLKSDLNLDRDGWLNLLMSHLIEPTLGQAKPLMVTDFPASQAALAKIAQQNDIEVAQRFEVYFNGVELANGYHELTAAEEQRQRFQQDNSKRQQNGKETITIDDNFMDALKQGLPDCAGVVLGVDRLVMLATQSQTIAQVLSFALARA